MKLINNRRANIFAELKTGDVFMFSGQVYMKIEEVSDELYCFYNTVDLSNGNLTQLNETDSIRPVSATLTIN